MSEVANFVIGLNNGALTHFLSGDFDQAIEMLRSAYDTFVTYKWQVAYMVSTIQGHSSTTPQQHAPIDRPVDPTRDGSCSTDEPRSVQGNPQVSALLSFNELFTLGNATVSTLMMMDCESVSNALQGQAKHGQITRARSCSSHSRVSSPSTSHSMYNRALVLPTDQDDITLLILHQHRTGAVIMYNLALMYHNIGIHLGLSSSALPQALRLYEQALTSIEQGGANVLDVHKLLMAILNNLANIYAHFYCIKETERCLESLRIVLAAASLDRTVDEDYSFFLVNALFQMKELSFAPAA